MAAGGNECCLCMEALEEGSFVQCCALDGVAHRMCDACFVNHVAHLGANRFQAHNGRVPCPADDWHGSYFSDGDLADVYVRRQRPRELELYLFRALPRLQGHDGAGDNEDEHERANRLLEAVNLRCPGCQDMIDPNQDACRAITCRNPQCQCHFCLVCFHISADDGANHRHVLQRHGDLFLAQNIVDAAHGHWRRRQVFDFMRDVPEGLRDAVWRHAREPLVDMDPELDRAAALDAELPILDPADFAAPGHGGAHAPGLAAAAAEVVVAHGDPWQQVVAGLAAAAGSEIEQTVMVEVTETVLKEVTEVSMKTVSEQVLKEVAETVVGEEVIFETVREVVKRPGIAKVGRRIWHSVNPKCSTGDKVIERVIKKVVPTETTVTKLVEETVTREVPEAVTTTVPTAVAKQVSDTIVKTTMRGAAVSAAASSVVFDACLVSYDVARSLAGRNAPQDMQVQLQNRVHNACWNASGSAAGAALGTAVLPGIGTLIGSTIGGIAAAHFHREVQ